MCSQKGPGRSTPGRKARSVRSTRQLCSHAQIPSSLFPPTSPTSRLEQVLGATHRPVRSHLVDTRAAGEDGVEPSLGVLSRVVAVPGRRVQVVVGRRPPAAIGRVPEAREGRALAVVHRPLACGCQAAHALVVVGEDDHVALALERCRGALGHGKAGASDQGRRQGDEGEK
jgi:hypothetical protein